MCDQRMSDQRLDIGQAEVSSLAIQDLTQPNTASNTASKTVWILAAGPLGTLPAPLGWAAPDYVIAADGGIEHAQRLGVQPDIWLGDFDSCQPNQCPQYAQVPRIAYPTEKDQLDSELALALAWEQAAEQVVIWGALAGRFDHSLALALIASKQPKPVILHGGTEWLQPLQPAQPLCLSLPIGTTFSVLALAAVQGLSIRGSYWPLQQASLAMGSGLGMSNRSVEPDIQIEITQGLAVLIVQTMR